MAAKKPYVLDIIKDAATSLLKWRGIEAMGGKDVLGWEMKDGRYGLAIQGPAFRLESRCFGENKWPIRNRDGYADYDLQKAFDLDVSIERGRGWSGIKGGAGQTMSDGEVSIDEIPTAIESVAGHATGYDFHVTIMPMEGKPWNIGSKCTPYFSAKKQKVLCGTKPDGVIKVDVDASFRSGEGERRENVPGIDFCTVAPVMRENEGGIVGEMGDHTILVTHCFNLDPKHGAGSPASIAKRIQACGGLLYPSLAVSEVPSVNFGPCCLVARLPVVLRVLKPYKVSLRGAWPVVLYTSDAWTGVTKEFSGTNSAILFEQLTGTWEPHSYGHMMVLGPQSHDYAGPVEARIIKSVTQVRSAIKKKAKVWHRSMTVEQIEDASSMPDRYPYLEAKVNCTLQVDDTFPVAVCPSYLKSKTATFLNAIGFTGALLVVPVKGETKRALRGEGFDFMATAKAQWDYGWMVRDAIVAWQQKQDASSANYKHDWAETVHESLYRGSGVFAKSADESDFNQPKLVKNNPYGFSVWEMKQ